MFLRYSPNIRAYRVYNKRSKTIMELDNVIIDDQGTISTIPRSDERNTEGPLHTSRDDASANDATLGNSHSIDTGDASPFSQSLS